MEYVIQESEYHRNRLIPASIFKTVFLFLVQFKIDENAKTHSHKN